jgi:hypothetical protein
VGALLLLSPDPVEVMRSELADIRSHYAATLPADLAALTSNRFERTHYARFVLTMFERIGQQRHFAGAGCNVPSLSGGNAERAWLLKRDLLTFLDRHKRELSRLEPHWNGYMDAEGQHAHTVMSELTTEIIDLAMTIASAIGTPVR